MKTASWSLLLATAGVAAASWGPHKEDCPTSTDGTCGGKKGYTCKGSKFGSSCSPHGWCGTGGAYHGYGCQGKFGSCGPAPSATAPVPCNNGTIFGNGTVHYNTTTTSSAASSTAPKTSSMPTLSYEVCTPVVSTVVVYQTVTLAPGQSIPAGPTGPSSSKGPGGYPGGPASSTPAGPGAPSNSPAGPAAPSSSAPGGYPGHGPSGSSVGPAAPSSSAPGGYPGHGPSGSSAGPVGPSSSAPFSYPHGGPVSSSASGSGSPSSASSSPAGPVSPSSSASKSYYEHESSSSVSAGPSSPAPSSSSSADESSSMSKSYYEHGSTSSSFSEGPTAPVSSSSAEETSSMSKSYYDVSSSSSAADSSSTPGSATGPSSTSSNYGIGSSSVPSSSSGAPYPMSTSSSGHSYGTGSSSGAPSTISSSVKSYGTVSASSYSFSHTTRNATSTSSSASCTVKPTPKCQKCKGAPGKGKWCGYDINTNYYESWPETCETKEFWLEVGNYTSVSPDGVPRMALLINGTMPGPLIEANWGDHIIIHVKNSLTTNGTSFHWHGMRQSGTNQHDGVNAITQCPIAPGDTMTYRFQATQYGSTWYHSHYAIQTWEGVFGPMIIHGPTTKDYDHDLGPVFLQDWTHVTVDSMYDDAQDPVKGGPRWVDTGLINGKNIWQEKGSSVTVGERFSVNFQKDKTYLIRLINVAIQSTFKFYIDGHSLTVIANDLVPIKPYTTKYVDINVGQRYDILVTADQPVDNYWMRSDNQAPCSNMTFQDIKGIVKYHGAGTSLPTSSPYNYTMQCTDESPEDLVPWVAIDVGPQAQTVDEFVTVAVDPTVNLFKWYLSGTYFNSDFSDPTLVHILNNGEIPTYSGALAVEAPNADEWIYIIIESPVPLPHPIHLHGHDFHVLGSGFGLYNGQSLNTKNPPRRDVASMPQSGQGGWLAIAFKTDNPGVWLLHCHIGWHTSMGFALQIIEQMDKIPDTIDDSCTPNRVCKNWQKWVADTGFKQFDSGV